MIGHVRLAIFAALLAPAHAGQIPTDLEQKFAVLRIAIRSRDNTKAKAYLAASAAQWGEEFTEATGISTPPFNRATPPLPAPLSSRGLAL